jgi:hypothetical protein
MFRGLIVMLQKSQATNMVFIVLVVMVLYRRPGRVYGHYPLPGLKYSVAIGKNMNYLRRRRDFHRPGHVLLSIIVLALAA